MAKLSGFSASYFDRRIYQTSVGCFDCGFVYPKRCRRIRWKSLVFRQKINQKNHLFEPDLQRNTNDFEHCFWDFWFVVFQCHFRHYQTQNRAVALWRTFINRTDCVFFKENQHQRVFHRKTTSQNQ